MGLCAASQPVPHSTLQSREWGRERKSSICASFLISLSSSKDGSDAWPCSGHIWDRYWMNKSLSALQCHWMYIYIPIRQLIDRAPIIETSCLKNHIPLLKVKDVLLARSYVSGSGSFYFWATKLRVIVSISLRTGSLFLQCLAITVRLITHMIREKLYHQVAFSLQTSLFQKCVSYL